MRVGNDRTAKDLLGLELESTPQPAPDRIAAIDDEILSTCAIDMLRLLAAHSVETTKTSGEALVLAEIKALRHDATPTIVLFQYRSNMWSQLGG